MNKIIIANNGSTWLDVTKQARQLWAANIFNLYELLLYKGDYGIALVETETQLNEALDTPDTFICIEVEGVPNPQPQMHQRGWPEADKVLINGHWFVKASHIRIM